MTTFSYTARSPPTARTARSGTSLPTMNSSPHAQAFLPASPHIAADRFTSSTPSPTSERECSLPSASAAALYRREKTGIGSACGDLADGGRAPCIRPKAVSDAIPVRNALPSPQGGGPFYSVFECADGEWLQDRLHPLRIRRSGIGSDRCRRCNRFYPRVWRRPLARDRRCAQASLRHSRRQDQDTALGRVDRRAMGCRRTLRPRQERTGSDVRRTDHPRRPRPAAGRPHLWDNRDDGRPNQADEDAWTDTRSTCTWGRVANPPLHGTGGPPPFPSFPRRNVTPCCDTGPEPRCPRCTVRRLSLLTPLHSLLLPPPPLRRPESWR